jgi:hypothetical protein
MCKEEKTMQVKDFLEEEGYRPTIDDDGDIAFKAEGMALVLTFDDRDEQFVRLILPSFWSIDSSEESKEAKEAALKVNKEIKAAKVFIVRDHVWATIEAFYETADSFTAVFQRSLGALRAAARSFAEEMRSTQSTWPASVADVVWPGEESDD